MAAAREREVGRGAAVQRGEPQDVGHAPAPPAALGAQKAVQLTPIAFPFADETVYFHPRGVRGSHDHPDARGRLARPDARGLGSRAFSGSVDFVFKARAPGLPARRPHRGPRRLGRGRHPARRRARDDRSTTSASRCSRGGRTPGKRMAGLRVVRSSGRPVDGTASTIRNAMRLDRRPAAALRADDHRRSSSTKHNQRPGDLAGDTVVIRDRRDVDRVPPIPPPTRSPPSTRSATGAPLGRQRRLRRGHRDGPLVPRAPFLARAARHARASPRSSTARCARSSAGSTSATPSASSRSSTTPSAPPGESGRVLASGWSCHPPPGAAASPRSTARSCAWTPQQSPMHVGWSAIFAAPQRIARGRRSRRCASAPPAGCTTSRGVAGAWTRRRSACRSRAGSTTPDFDLAAHVVQLTDPEDPVDDGALRGAALGRAVEPLDRSRPLWQVVARAAPARRPRRHGRQDPSRAGRRPRGAADRQPVRRHRARPAVVQAAAPGARRGRNGRRRLGGSTRRATRARDGAGALRAGTDAVTHPRSTVAAAPRTARRIATALSEERPAARAVVAAQRARSGRAASSSATARRASCCRPRAAAAARSTTSASPPSPARCGRSRCGAATRASSR